MTPADLPPRGAALRLRPVSTVICTSDVDDAALARLLVPRTDLVTERPTGPATFELAQGPYTRWTRRSSPSRSPTAATT